MSHNEANDVPRVKRPISISNWLYAVAFLVFIMIIVGGITRLTESGLSITEWKPITGAIPPLSEAAWLSEFEKYKQIPEYLEINGPAGMTLDDFKFIYFWEWVHRLLGRLIGLAFALPLAWFAFKRAIPEGYGGRLAGLLVLGGMQGAIGWWMVVSGLTERTDVSHFRLATHLLMALLILAALVWTALDMRQVARGRHRPSRPTAFGLIVAIPVFFDVALVLLLPLTANLARRSGRAILGFAIPLLAGIAVAHSFIPPTPGPVAVAGLLGADLGWVILFGFLAGVPATVVGGLWWGRFVAERVSVEIPQGKLRVRARPKARLFIDGAPAGKTPFKGKLHVGTYRLRLEAEGHAPVEREVEVREGGAERVTVRF